MIEVAVALLLGAGVGLLFFVATGPHRLGDGKPDYARIAALERELLDPRPEPARIQLLKDVYTHYGAIAAARVEIEQSYRNNGNGWMPPLVEREAMAELLVRQRQVRFQSVPLYSDDIVEASDVLQ